MGAVVVAGASLQCPFGTVPATLSVTSQGSVLAEGKPVATIQDFAPAVNISGCGMCSSMANPLVASATAAALGVLTPQPCIPAVAGTWIPAQTKCIVDGKPWRGDCHMQLWRYNWHHRYRSENGNYCIEDTRACMKQIVTHI